MVSFGINSPKIRRPETRTVSGLSILNLPQTRILVLLKVTGGLLKAGLRGETWQEEGRGMSQTNSEHLPQGRIAVLHSENARELGLGAPLKQRALYSGTTLSFAIKKRARRPVVFECRMRAATLKPCDARLPAGRRALHGTCNRAKIPVLHNRRNGNHPSADRRPATCRCAPSVPSASGGGKSV